MNESLLLIQITFIILFSFAALKMGKEALTALIGTEALLANLFVLKEIPLFGLHVTCSDGFAIGSLLGLNLLREHFGAKSSQKALGVCFLILLFSALASQLHLFFEPTSHNPASSAYAAILSPSPRLLLASLFTFFLVQKLDLFLFQRFSPSRSLTLRSHGSLIICQLADTLLFTLFGLYGLVESLWQVALVSFLIKLLLILSLTPLTLFSRRVHAL